MTRQRLPNGEAAREELETGFTPLLRWLMRSSPAVLAVAFVDHEGECVDYCSGLAPFDAKVAGAHMLVVASEVRAAVNRLGGGELYALDLYGSERDLLVRRLDAHYQLVVVVRSAFTDRRLFEAIERAVVALRREAELEPPAWDPHAGPLEVELRQAVGWAYAPVAFHQAGHRVGIADVLGRWIEEGGPVGGELVCFRVRTEQGAELTLAHDPSQDRWLQW